MQAIEILRSWDTIFLIYFPGNILSIKWNVEAFKNTTFSSWFFCRFAKSLKYCKNLVNLLFKLKIFQEKVQLQWSVSDNQICLWLVLSDLIMETLNRLMKYRGLRTKKKFRVPFKDFFLISKMLQHYLSICLFDENSLISRNELLQKKIVFQLVFMENGYYSNWKVWLASTR